MKLEIKKATIEHVNKLSIYRYNMFEEMKKFDNIQSKKEDIISASKKYYKLYINDNNHYSVVIEINNKVIGCGTLLIQHRPPSPIFESNKVGYILNIYIDKPYRKKGFATQIMNHFHEYAKINDISKIGLNASKDGINLYKRLNYTIPDNYMEYVI